MSMITDNTRNEVKSETAPTVLIWSSDITDGYCLTNSLKSNFRVNHLPDICYAKRVVNDSEFDVFVWVSSDFTQQKKEFAVIANLFEGKIIVLSKQPSLAEELFFSTYGVLDYFEYNKPTPILVNRINTMARLVMEKKHLAKQSAIDGLTKLYNRKKFDAEIEKEWKRCLRNQNCMSLVMADVDCFKAFNDTYGHVRGDECLKAVANALKSATQRENDLVARYGGEEFAIILPCSDIEGAAHVAQNACEAVENLAILHAKNQAKPLVTISVGVVTFYPSWPNNAVSSVKELTEMADCALFEAKNSGRNGYCVKDSRIALIRESNKKAENYEQQAVI